MFTAKTYVEFGLLSGFDLRSLQNLARVYEVKIVDTATTVRGVMTRIDFRIEGTLDDIKSFNNALSSMNRI